MEETAEAAVGTLRVMLDLGVVISIAIGSLLILLWFVQTRKLASRRLPPGPRRLPVIGNLHLLALSGKPPHQAFEDLSKKHGPLMSLKLGSITAIVATSSKYAKEILKTHNQHFASKAGTAAAVIMNYDRANIVWAPNGDHLKTGRRVIQTDLVNNKRVAASEEIIKSRPVVLDTIKTFCGMSLITDVVKKVRVTEVLTCLHDILEECEQGSKSIYLVEKISKLSTRNISRMVFGNGSNLFGKDRAQSKELEDEFMTMVNRIFRYTGMIVIGDFIPSLKRFDIMGIEAEMAKLAKQSDEIYSRILEDHRPNVGKIIAEPDFVDILLAVQKREGLSDNNVKAMVADIIFAATDTSATQITWTFAELMRHPEILQKAQQELDSVVGRTRLVKESDIPNLPYLQAIVKESFRLHPAAGTLQYESTQDTHIDGYFIPAKSRVFVNNYAISRSEENWDNALQYRPERFSDGGCRRDVRGQDFELLPFGSGRRMCIGMSLGLIIVQYAVAQLLHVCEFSLPAGMNPKDVDMSEDFGITTPMKTKLQLIATPRLAPSVLESALAALD